MIWLAIAAVAAIVQGNIAAVIPTEHRLVEGVAVDRQHIWVSSVLDRQILECSHGCRPIAVLPAGLHPLGIAWDWSRDLIWVAADCPDLPGIARCRRGALLAVTPTGRIVWKLAPEADFHPGDVSVSLHAVFVSDSRSGLVYGLLPRRMGLRPINRAGDGKSAQGTALTPDGTHVVVADYARGIGSIDMKSGTTTWLINQNGKPLRRVDGLVRCGERYFGVYNGSSPGKVLSISATHGSVRVRELRGVGSLPDPTQIAFDGKRLLVVSNAGWEPARKIGDRRRQPARIVEIPLPEGCNS